MLRPQDILLVLKIQASGPNSFASLGGSIGISVSQAFASAKRATEAGLLRKDLSVRPRALFETLLATKHYFPVRLGGLVRGVPTAHSAAPLKEQMGLNDEPPFVWPHPDGGERGIAFEPIYKTVATAALGDPILYEYLALVDAIRGGRAREANWARSELERRLSDGPE